MSLLDLWCFGVVPEAAPKTGDTPLKIFLRVTVTKASAHQQYGRWRPNISSPKSFLDYSEENIWQNPLFNGTRTNFGLWFGV
jgi:hypothetical protein